MNTREKGRDGRTCRTIYVQGDPLRCLDGIGACGPGVDHRPALLIVGIDARRVRTKAGLVTLLTRRKRTALRAPATTSQIIAVIDHVGHAEPWMHTTAHRWALSIHSGIQRGRGLDMSVTVLLVDWRSSPELIAERLEELARRSPGINPAAVLSAHELRTHTIAQAATNGFI